ncbi:MAG TPA: anti-sigma factor [Solirubrobacteraceae bacterium]|nr:anti-sigma factor [Solirubrobacteraceae bacterium]
MSRFLHSLRFKRDHRWAPDHMSEYLDEELGARARVRMDRHTKECPECRGVLGGLRRVVSALRRLPHPRGGPDAAEMTAAVLRRLHEHSDH